MWFAQLHLMLSWEYEHQQVLERLISMAISSYPTQQTWSLPVLIVIRWGNSWSLVTMNVYFNIKGICAKYVGGLSSSEFSYITIWQLVMQHCWNVVCHLFLQKTAVIFKKMYQLICLLGIFWTNVKVVDYDEWVMCFHMLLLLKAGIGQLVKWIIRDCD